MRAHTLAKGSRSIHQLNVPPRAIVPRRILASPVEPYLAMTEWLLGFPGRAPGAYDGKCGIR